MLAWLGLFMFGAVVLTFWHESRSRKFEREQKRKSIERRKAALDEKHKADDSAP